MCVVRSDVSLFFCVTVCDISAAHCVKKKGKHCLVSVEEDKTLSEMPYSLKALRALSLFI